MSQKIRIMFYSDSSIFGGAEQYLYILIKGLNPDRYTVSFVSPGGDGLKEFRNKLIRLGVDILVVDPIKNKFDFVNIIRQYRFFKRNPVDILHINLSNPYHSQFSILTAKIAGVPSIIVTQHLPGRLNKVSWKGRLLERLLARSVDKVITVFESGRKLILERLPFPEEKVIAIHNGIDINDKPEVDSTTMRSGMNIESECPVIGTIGRLTEQKGHKYFLDAAVTVKRKIMNVKFIIVGEGPLREELERYSNSLGLEKDIIFTGHRDDIYTILNMMDVFVLSSIYEGMPLTILEAMSMKKPVVATNVNGVPEVVVDSKTGILMPPRDSEALAKAIISLLKDKKKAEEMGEEGFRRVREYFSSSLMVGKTEEIYRELLAKSRKSKNLDSCLRRNDE